MDMKLVYQIIKDDGDKSEVKEMTIGNLYSLKESHRPRKAKGCAARENFCSVYDIKIISLEDCI